MEAAHELVFERGPECVQIALRGDVGPTDGRQHLRQRDPGLVAERALDGLGELETTTFIDRQFSPCSSTRAMSSG
jgi:hypothetical protein